MGWFRKKTEPVLEEGYWMKPLPDGIDLDFADQVGIYEPVDEAKMLKALTGDPNPESAPLWYVELAGEQHELVRADTVSFWGSWVVFQIDHDSENAYTVAYSANSVVSVERADDGDVDDVEPEYGITIDGPDYPDTIGVVDYSREEKPWRGRFDPENVPGNVPLTPQSISDLTEPSEV